MELGRDSDTGGQVKFISRGFRFSIQKTAVNKFRSCAVAWGDS